MGPAVNRPEAEQIAAAITLIRPDWLKVSLVTLLAKHQHRPVRDVMLALVWIAYDPDTKAPGRISTDGPWWHIGRLAGAETADVPPPYTPPPAIQAADQATIRALRAQHPIQPTRDASPKETEDE